MSDVLIDNVFVHLVDESFNRQFGIPKVKSCAPLLTDLFLNAHQPEVPQELFKYNYRKLAI
jgi:hypothetical protein